MNMNAMNALAINQYMQTSQRILSMLEKAKSNTEELVDNLPFVFGVIKQDGCIIKGNQMLAQFLKCSHIEDTLGLNIKSLFRDTTWEMFTSKCKLVTQKESVHFELTTDGIEKPYIVLWNLAQVKDAPIIDGEALYSLCGVDVTTTRQYEKQLSLIFCSIPLGIFRLDEQLLIQGPISKYTQVILGEETEVVGKSFFDLIYHRGWELLTLSEKEKAENLKGIIGFSDFQYDLMKDNLLKKLKFEDDRGLRWIGINFEPIVGNGDIIGLLVIIEDRTQLELESLKRLEHKKTEEKIIQRYVDLKTIDTQIADNIFSDLIQFFHVLNVCREKNQVQDVMRHLHGIKGTSRTAGFSMLMDLSHHAEDEIKKTLSLEGVTEILKELYNEWEEVKLLATMLHIFDPTRNNEVCALSHLQRQVEATALKTAEALEKEVELNFEWVELTISQSMRSLLSQCLVHLITNAVYHGIELPDVRMQNKKKPIGSISISSSYDKEDDILLMTIVDDGAGINSAKIRKKALELGLIEKSIASGISDDAICDLIFSPNLSSADSVDKLAGRGVGLDAVRTALESVHGQVTVSSKLGRGCVFKITLPIHENKGK